MSLKITGNWGEVAINFLHSSKLQSKRLIFPLIIILPLSGLLKPNKRSKIVLLPTPVFPVNATISSLTLTIFLMFSINKEKNYSLSEKKTDYHLMIQKKK